jgi:thiamine biosynthesis lipoprotein
LAWNRPVLLISIITLLLALGWLRMQSAGEQKLRSSQLLMGTVVEIVVYGEDEERLEEAINDAFAEMGRLETLLSRHYEDSDVTRLSQSKQGGKVATETAEVIRMGLDIARKSGGAFDLTLGRLKALWGFGEDNPTVPAAHMIKEAIRGIGPQSISIDRLTVTKQTPELMVDLGGIAKGYAVDKGVATLKRHGISNAAINAGGDMYLLGQLPQRPWRIGIQHPRQQGGVLATVQVSNRAVVSSGDYERFFETDGQRYHHIFDPQTGQPARRCQSVTVIADNVALGDALATALFVLGPQAGLKLLQQYPGAEALIIAADGTHHPSPGWENLLAKP